ENVVHWWQLCWGVRRNIRECCSRRPSASPWEKWHVRHQNDSRLSPRLHMMTSHLVTRVVLHGL
ncbi:unnamed protein product, partial [Ectocarpus sp. 12 AP-2014]